MSSWRYRVETGYFAIGLPVGVARIAQKIDLILSYEFPGDKLTQIPAAIDFAFGSIAGVPARFDTEAKRQFKITIDGTETSESPDPTLQIQ
jgi:hypothetical protein